MSTWVDLVCVAVSIALPLGAHIRQQWECVAMRQALASPLPTVDSDPMRTPPFAHRRRAGQA